MSTQKKSILPTNEDINIFDKETDFLGMEKSGRLAKSILDYIEKFVQPGVTTNELNDLCHEMIIKNDAIPAPLNYRGFPKSVCTSTNHIVCHGIPSDKKLIEGDIINIDVTTIVDGWHGDTSRTFMAGDPKKNVKGAKLIQVTYDAMMKGIELVKPGVKLNEIGKAIQEYAEGYGYSVVREYCGHGTGRIFHTRPNVLHYDSPTSEVIIEPGMFFTIEPMINIGKRDTKMLGDGWTVVTKDKSLSAQFEHTLGVKENETIVFTALS